MSENPKEPDSVYVKLAGAIGGSGAGIFFIAAFFWRPGLAGRRGGGRACGHGLWNRYFD